MKMKKISTAINFSLISTLKKYYDLNRKEHETKNKQIIERTSFQQICNARSKTKN